MDDVVVGLVDDVVVVDLTVVVLDVVVGLVTRVAIKISVVPPIAATRCFTDT